MYFSQNHILARYIDHDRDKQITIILAGDQTSGDFHGLATRAAKLLQLIITLRESLDEENDGAPKRDQQP